VDLESALIEIVLDHLVFVGLSEPSTIDEEALDGLLGGAELHLAAVDDGERARLADALRACVDARGAPEQRDVVHALVQALALDG
jgi:hypothetical protein